MSFGRKFFIVFDKDNIRRARKISGGISLAFLGVFYFVFGYLEGIKDLALIGALIIITLLIVVIGLILDMTSAKKANIERHKKIKMQNRNNQYNPDNFYRQESNYPTINFQPQYWENNFRNGKR